MRRVEVTNRFENSAYVRSVPATKTDDRTAVEEGKPISLAEPLREGERVLTTGALELKTALETKLAENVTPDEQRAL